MPSLRKLLENPLFCALLAIGLVACHRTPDESRVRQGVEAAEQAAEQADASALDALLSDDFSGNNGEMERRQIVGLLRAARFRGETIHALTGPIEVEARGERYVARFTVTLTSGGKLLPAQIGVYRVETAWRKEGREWRCYSATWTNEG
ncbi:hypothetical protein [Dyella kyungheensis]|uniref:Nuclear transport factor 2 family protein n=1 Tax=Dyella kyungheensis TaxID=1242174 RepID=A0ABS2JTK1_9GAMM|nr:hypothetical protein [Dyella kyungheensis]MBM7121909.1 hypothetical protein [Dyella kyungheensis]